MNLETKFKKETGFDAYADNDLKPKVPSNYYVKWLEEQLTLTDVVKSLPTEEEINLAANGCSDVNGVICADEYWVIAKNNGFKEGVKWLINRLK